MTRWVYRNSDFMWMVRSAGDPALIHSQLGAYTLVELAQDECPDPRTTRGQTAPPYIRAATAAEQAAYEQSGLDAQVTSLMDNERVFAALIWAILDTYSAPATRAKFQAARAKIIAAYRDRPWLP